MIEPKLSNHLRAWREFRRMTQEELAEKAGTTASVISLLENGQRRLSLKWLYKLAPPLKTSPGFIVDYEPEDLPSDILDIWADIPEQAQPQALAVLRTFRKKAI